MRPLLRSAELRTTLVVVVLAVAGVFALWPRPDAQPAGSATPWSVDGAGTMAAPAGPEVDALRAAADLRPCPTPQPGTPQPGTPQPGTPQPGTPQPGTLQSAGLLAGIVVPCLGGPGEVDLAAALAGRPALLNVWASWCGPCRAEIPALDAYANRPDAIPVVGIDVRDDAGAALSLLDELGARYPSVVDTDGELWAALEVPLAIPTSYVLRADGSLRRVDPVVLRTPDEVAQAVRSNLAAP